MYKYIQKIMILMAISAGLAGLLSPALVLAAPSPSTNAVCEGVALTGSDCTSTAGPSVEKSVAIVVNLFSFFVGIAAVIMIIIGGFKYIISSGDSSND